MIDNQSMAKILIRLRGVPDDEIRDILELLEKNRVDFYETDAGNWGISMPALWLQDEDDYPRARDLLDDYQANRQQRARSDWNSQLAQGTQPTFWQILTRRPLITVGLLLFCGIVAWFSVRPFITMLS